MKNAFDIRVSEINAFYSKRRKGVYDADVEPQAQAETVEERKCTKCGHAWERESRAKDYFCPKCGCSTWKKPRPVYHCKTCAYEWKPQRTPLKCPDCNSRDFYALPENGLKCNK